MDREEVAQETLLGVWMHLSDIRELEAFDAYVFRAARRLALNRVRDRKVGAAVSIDELAEKGVTLHQTDRDACPVDVLLRTRDGRVVEYLLEAACSPKQRIALRLHHFQGCEHRVIADLTGWPMGTVSTLLSRGLRRLRAHVFIEKPQDIALEELAITVEDAQKRGLRITERERAALVTRSRTPAEARAAFRKLEPYLRKLVVLLVCIWGIVHASRG